MLRPVVLLLYLPAVDHRSHPRPAALSSDPRIARSASVLTPARFFRLASAYAAHVARHHQLSLFLELAADAFQDMLHADCRIAPAFLGGEEGGIERGVADVAAGQLELRWR